MAPEEARVEANIDFSRTTGFFLRLDVKDESRPGMWSWIGLTEEEADDLASELTKRAAEVKARNADWRSRRDRG